MALKRKKEYLIEESSEDKEIFDVKPDPKKKTENKVGGAPTIGRKKPDFGLGDILSSMKATAGRAKFEESDSEEENSLEEKTRFSLNSDKF